MSNNESNQKHKVFKVFVSNPEVPDPVLELLERHGCGVLVCQSFPPSRTEILEKLPGVDGILWAHFDALNAEILDAAGPQLKAVSTMSSGFEYADLAAFKERQLPLGHTPGIVKHSAADLAIGLMISAGRHFQEGRWKIMESQWITDQINRLMGQEVRGSVVGFYGFGGIGQAIAKRLQNWEVAKFIYTTRTRKDNDVELGATQVPFEVLLKESDFLVVVCPLTPQTSGVFNESAFGQMKRNCVFVNVARGGVVDQDALYKALVSGQIFAAGLDVMTPEPLPADHPLLKLPNCIITPHLGGQTMRTMIEVGEVAARNILNVFEAKPMLYPISY